MLSVVATPIGNMMDITLRAIDTLKRADLIAAEDTRTTRVLMQHHGIQTPMVAYHDKNERSMTPRLLEMLVQGKHICLVTDAGTPGISDPGFLIIREAARAHVKIEPIPGPSAVLCALSASGLPMDQFVFVGFLPKGPGKRAKLVSSFADEERTIVCYESPHRIMRTLEEFARLIPDKSVCLGRELTKKFEEFIRGSPMEVLEETRKRKVLGEITLVIGRGPQR